MTTTTEAPSLTFQTWPDSASLALDTAGNRYVIRFKPAAGESPWLAELRTADGEDTFWLGRFDTKAEAFRVCNYVWSA
jgi:hypothetical protein